MEVHIVQKGDTLWKISRQYGISFEELKRVNAHLANPDYIVPGMKIFLPEKKETHATKPGKDTGTVHKKKQEEKPAKPPVKKKEVKEKVKEELPVPQEPIPLPQAPQMQQQQHHPMPQMPMHTIPIVGIPCGWLPIYDADCHHHAQMDHMHHPTPAPIPPAPKPQPTLPSLAPAYMESPLHTEHHSSIKPKVPSMDWEEKDHKSIESTQLPIQSGGMLPPMPPMQEPMPMPPMSAPQHYRQPHTVPCGCHYQMMPQMPQMQQSNYCNACYQPMPYQMMPSQGQNPNWHGSY